MTVAPRPRPRVFYGELPMPSGRLSRRLYLWLLGRRRIPTTAYAVSLSSMLARDRLERRGYVFRGEVK